MKQLTVLLLLLLTFSSFAQNVGINSTGANPDNSAMLDVASANKGILIPRVALTATNVAAPIATPATSLVVYNTATAGTAPNNVTPGFYYWDGTVWARLDSKNAWQTKGNTGTNPTNNFLGTIDNQDMVIRTNNTEKVRIENNGNVGVGIVDPTHKLHVNGGDIALEGDKAFVIGGDNTNTPDVTPDAQLVLDGAHNDGYNNTGTKLLIRGINNESNVKAIDVYDENNNNIFYVTSNSDANGESYFKGNVGVGVIDPTRKLQVNGFTSSGMLTMGMDCSYEGDLGGPEHNDYGCFMCAVDPDNGNLFCSSTRNDQEEVGDIAGNSPGPVGGTATGTTVWTNWTDFGFPGPAGTYIQEVEVHVAATNLDDSGSFTCNGENDWGASIAIRLSNGDIYFRMTTTVDACIEQVGSNTGSWSAWRNMGQP